MQPQSIRYDPAQLPPRIASKIVVDENGCWVWQAAMTRGYGVFRWEGRRNIYIHRFAYALFVGPIRDGLWVLHRCDNPPCCNPAHLFLGTQKDNMRDMHTKGRANLTSRVRGEESPHAKLTEAAVIDIRSHYERGVVTLQMFADKYGVSIQAVRAALVGQRWRYLKEPIERTGVPDR